jgi:hypothetical protein
MVKNHFDKGPEGWCSYDYHATVAAGDEIFVLTSWSASGGVDDAGYIWSDHHRWSADTPEKPISILALIHYRNWVGADPVDLRDAAVSFYLRGDGLNINTAKCYFWAHVAGNRWHCHAQPITIPQGKWGDAPTVIKPTTDESQWYCSWQNPSHEPVSLEGVLSGVHSYGFSFVGFGSEVSGRLSLSRFEIR